MNNQIQTKPLSPDVQQLVDNIMIGIVALASRANSNMNSNSIGGSNFCSYFYWFLGQEKVLLKSRSRGERRKWPV